MCERTKRSARGRMITAAVLGVLYLVCVSRGEAGYVLFFDDRSGFADEIQKAGGLQIVDTAGAFGADPMAGTVSEVRRAGLLAGELLEYAAFDVDYSNTPTGTLTAGIVGGDIADLDSMSVERPVSQGAAVGLGTWGLDSSGGSTASRNALLVDVLQTPRQDGLSYFGVDLHDFEASLSATPAELRLYDDGNLVFRHEFDWGPSGDGNDQTHFLGMAADSGAALFDQVLIAIGDDNGTGYSERWAADRFTFGVAGERSSGPAEVPEPATLVLVSVGGAALLIVRGGRLCRRGRDRAPVTAA